MIQWQILENKLRNYFERSSIEGATRTPEKSALQIENYYIETILLNGEDTYGNRVSNLNKYTLYNSLSRGFKSSLLIKNGAPSDLNSSGMSGLLTMWNGASLTMEIPPPGSVRVISNSVTNAGTYPILSISLTSLMLPQLMDAFKTHVKTVSGITTSLVYTGTSLIPVQFTWTGIK